MRNDYCIEEFTITHRNYRRKVREKKTRKILYIYWGYDYVHPVFKTLKGEDYKRLRENEYVYL